MRHSISVPTLLLDQERCLRNIKRMADKAATNQVSLRPHFKTHQSLTIGRWFRDFGIEQITVSSVRMAQHFVQDGWQDITIAFPVNVLEIRAIKELASQISLKLVVENPEGVAALQNAKLTANVFIKADTGAGRTGLGADQWDEIDTLTEQIKAVHNLHFKGFLCHAGHSYKARSKKAILEVHHQSLEIMQQFKKRYESTFPQLVYSIGDTPTCSVADTFPDINEIRPGNFVFYDLTQSQIGSCSADDIAVAMACPVVAKHLDRHEIIIYGGGIHFSKDRLVLSNGQTVYGQLVSPSDLSWSITADTSYVRSLSQEHGVIAASPEVFKRTKIGDIVYILPVHSCMTADLMKKYQLTNGHLIDDMLQY